MKWKVLSVLVLMIFLCACETNDKMLNKAGILGQHELYREKEVVGDSDYDNFFSYVSTGSLKGKMKHKYGFYWKDKKSMTVSSMLPVDLFEFVIDYSKKERPTIEFVFKKDWLSRLLIKVYDNPELADPNEFLESDWLIITAKVKISEEQLKKEGMYNPFAFYKKAE